jgi:hypothetical protein
MNNKKKTHLAEELLVQQTGTSKEVPACQKAT